MQDYMRALRKRVGANVRRLREGQGLSQPALAERVGNNDRHIGQIERAEVNVGLDVLASLAEHLSVDIEELFRSLPDQRSAKKPSAITLEGEDLVCVRRAVGAILRADFTARNRPARKSS